MRILATLLAIPLLSGCALLMTTSISGGTTFTGLAGYQITCTTGPVPIASGHQSFQFDEPGCTRIAEDGVQTFLAQHPGAKVDSVTVEADAVKSICYTLNGSSECVVPN